MMGGEFLLGEQILEDAQFALWLTSIYKLGYMYQLVPDETAEIILSKLDSSYPVLFDLQERLRASDTLNLQANRYLRSLLLVDYPGDREAGRQCTLYCRRQFEDSLQGITLEPYSPINYAEVLYNSLRYLAALSR